MHKISMLNSLCNNQLIKKLPILYSYKINEKIKKMFDFVTISIYNENIANEILKKINCKIKFKKLRRSMG